MWWMQGHSVTSHNCYQMNDLKPSLFSHRGTIRTCPFQQRLILYTTDRQADTQADPIGWIVNSNSPSTAVYTESLPPKLKLSTRWLTSNHPYLFCEDVCLHDIHHLLVRTGQIGTNLFHQPLLSCHTRVAITVLEEGSKVTLGQVSRQ